MNQRFANYDFMIYIIVNDVFMYLLCLTNYVIMLTNGRNGMNSENMHCSELF